MISEKDKIKHLHARAGFGMTINQWQYENDIKKSIDTIFQTKQYKKLTSVTLSEVEAAKEKMKSMTKEDVKDLKQLMKSNVFELNNLWLNEMINSEAQLHEKMALFWHGHFACRSANPYFDQQYLDIIRKNALGNFSVLLKEVSKTPAMLQFLNNQQNKKDHPNENFAREVMELFTLGRGNYTEDDVKEAARAFTGYGFDKAGEFKFKAQQHDFGVKHFLGKTGNFSGEDILQIISEKKECAYFITKKIFHFFVNDISDETIIQQLANQFYQSNYDIKKLMKTIFSSDWFYDEKNIGVRIKSPLELIAGMFRLIPTDFENAQSIIFIQRTLGQILLNPPNVAGWPGGRSWIDSSSLLFRMRLPQIVYYDKDLDIEPKEETPESKMQAQHLKMADEFVKKIASKKLMATSDWSSITKYFLNTDDVIKEISTIVLSKKSDVVGLKSVETNTDTSTRQNEIKSAMIHVLSLPEYQLC
ncbi:MAG: DUF1800 domain-containing protein [Chitinophagales bacterium]